MQFYFKCAVIRERTASGALIHDGFLPFNCNINDIVKRIKQIYPNIDSQTKLFTIGKFT